MHSELQTLEQKLDAQRRQVRESEQVQKQLKKLENSRKQFAFQQQQRNQLLDGLEKLFLLWKVLGSNRHVSSAWYGIKRLC